MWLVILVKGLDWFVLCVSGYRFLVLNLVGEVLNCDRLNLVVRLFSDICNLIGCDEFKCVISDSSVCGVMLFLCRFLIVSMLRCLESFLFCGLVSRL